MKETSMSTTFRILKAIVIVVAMDTVKMDTERQWEDRCLWTMDLGFLNLSRLARQTSKSVQAEIKSDCSLEQWLASKNVHT